MVAIAVMSFFTLGIVTLISAANQQTAMWNQRLIAEDSIRELVDCMNSSTAWNNTVAANPSMACLAGVGDCRPLQANPNLQVQLRNEQNKLCLDTGTQPRAYDSANRAHGFTANGQLCTDFGTNPDCIYRIDVAWQPSGCPPPALGPCRSPIVRMRFTYRALGTGAFNINRVMYRAGEVTTNDWFVLFDRHNNNTKGGECKPLRWNKRKFTKRQIVGEEMMAGWVENVGMDTIRLRQGTYICRIASASYRTQQHQVRLINAATGAALFYGTSETTNFAAGGTSPSLAVGTFFVPTEMPVSLEHWCLGVPLTGGIPPTPDKDVGLGKPVNAGTPETYAYMECSRRQK